MEKAVSQIVKLSHKQFRAMLKKFRRKRKRQQLAKERERLEELEQKRLESSPNYKERQEELRRNIELYEQFEEKERIRQNKLWLLREQQAQEEFRRKQQHQELEKIRLEEERKRILEEFEKQQFVESKNLEESERIKSQKEEVLQATLSNLAEKEDSPWHNPIAPENYNTGIEREHCMFFSKTGCCRFGDRCSRGHSRPDVSNTILIRGMYSHFSIGQTATDDYDTDIALEYEDKECYQHFKNFYRDVHPEFKKYGKVIQFKVCSNFEPHLRGNVYIQYSSEKEAIEAYKNFNGRYYAGKQINCEFTNISRWKAAICGLYGKKLCPKGINCNFLHVFKNPDDEYWEADRDLQPRTRSHHFSRHSERDERYSHHSSEHKHNYRSSRYEPRSDRHDYRNDRYEPRSERHEPRSERHEPRSDRHEPRSDRHEPRSDRHEPRSDRHDSRYESRSERRESTYDYSTESDTDSSGENFHCSQSNNSSDKHRKRHRYSRSKSPEVSNGEISRKKKKHKKKSRKSKKKGSSDVS